MWPMRASFSTIEIAELALRRRLALIVRRRHVRLVHLHEIDVHEERLRCMRMLVEIVERRFFDIAVKEGDADHALVRRIDILTVDLEVLVRGLAGVARHRALGDLVEHVAKFLRHVREPGRIAVGIGVEMIEPGIFHHVVALGVRQRIVGLAKMPFAGEERVVAAGLQDRGQRPFGGRQAAALSLERDRRHAAAIGNAPRLDRRAAGGATRLPVEGPELHPLVGDAVEVRGRRAAVIAAAIDAHVAVAEVVRHDEHDVGFLDLGRSGDAGQGESAKRHSHRRR